MSRDHRHRWIYSKSLLDGVGEVLEFLDVVPSGNSIGSQYGIYFLEYLLFNIGIMSKSVEGPRNCRTCCLLQEKGKKKGPIENQSQDWVYSHGQPRGTCFCCGCCELVVVLGVERVLYVNVWSRICWTVNVVPTSSRASSKRSNSVGFSGVPKCRHINIIGQKLFGGGGRNIVLPFSAIAFFLVSIMSSTVLKRSFFVCSRSRFALRGSWRNPGMMENQLRLLVLVRLVKAVNIVDFNSFDSSSPLSGKTLKS